MRCSRTFHKVDLIECGCVLSYEGCLSKGHPYPGSNLSRRNPSFFRDHSPYPLHNNSPVKKHIMNYFATIKKATFVWHQPCSSFSGLCFGLHITSFPPFLDLILISSLLLGTVSGVSRLSKKLRKCGGFIRGKPFTLLRHWRWVGFDARVLACPVRLTTTRANPCPTLSQ